MALYVVLVALQLGRRDLLNDELYSLAATHHLAETVRRTHGTMALYYVVLWPWARLSHHPVWLHLPSAVALAASIGVLARVVAAWFGQRTGRWAGMFAAASAALVRHGVEARSYALWALAVSLAWFHLHRCVASDDRRSRWWFAACVVAMPLLHGLSGVVLVGYLLTIAWCRLPRALAVRLSAPVVLALLLVATLWAAGGHEVGYFPPNDLDSARRFVRGLVFPGVRPAALLVAIAAAGAAAVVRLPTATAGDRLRQVGLLMWGPGCTFGLLLLSAVRPSMAFRYALPSALGFAGLLAVASTRSHRTVLTRLGPPLLAAGLLVGQGELRLPNHEWRSAAHHVSVRYRPGDGIAFVPADARLAYEAALAAGPAAHVPHLVGTGDPLGTFDRFGSVDDPAATGAAAARSARLWVVAIRAGIEPNRGMVQELLGHPTIRRRFRVGDRIEIGDVTIWRLDRISAEVD
ncbi:MAG: hypothetical protein R2746_13865 [Acidimicrobiales bacterium]